MKFEYIVEKGSEAKLKNEYFLLNDASFVKKTKNYIS